MKNLKVLGLIIQFLITGWSIATAQIDQLITTSTIYFDKVEFHIYNPTTLDISLSYIVIQDNILGIKQGQGTISTDSTFTIEVPVESAKLHTFSLELTEMNELTIGFTTPSISTNKNPMDSKRRRIDPSQTDTLWNTLCTDLIRVAFKRRLFNIIDSMVSQDSV